MKNEFILQKIWEQHSFLPNNLKTTDNKSLEIIEFGTINHSNGPDFINAKVKIDNQIHAGDVEIHYLSSTWHQHQHQHDPRYNRVILHVVWKHDQEIQTQNNSTIHTLELKSRVTSSLLQHLVSQPELPICSNELRRVPEKVISQQFEMASKELIKVKTLEIMKIHASLGDDWWKTWFWLHLKSFLGPMNHSAAIQITERVSKRYVMSCKTPNDIIAYLFGLSGWISGSLTDETTDDYTLLLQQKFDFFRFKHEWVSPFDIQWNYKQVRPSSFPQLRMAQFAIWLFESESNFEFLTDIHSFQWNQEFQKFKKIADPYWETHYQLGKTSKSHTNKIGKNTIATIAINCWYYGLYAYAKAMQIPNYEVLANMFLKYLPVETNRHTKWMNQLFKRGKNMKGSQELMAQYKLFCSKKACSKCLIGMEILQGTFMKYQQL